MGILTALSVYKPFSFIAAGLSLFLCCDLLWAQVQQASPFPNQNLGPWIFSGIAWFIAMTLAVISFLLWRAAKVLRRDHARLARVYQASDDGFWEWDIATGHAYYTPKFLRLLGISPAESRDKTPLELFNNIVHPIDRAYVIDKLNYHLQAGHEHGIDIEFRIVKGQRQNTWLWLRGKLMRDPGNARLVLVGLITDIYARKHREEQMFSLDRHVVTDLRSA
jgi:PAS domain S-box-containing protein